LSYPSATRPVRVFLLYISGAVMRSALKKEGEMRMDFILKTVTTAVLAGSILVLSACEPPRDTTRDGQWGTGEGTEPQQSAGL